MPREVRAAMVLDTALERVRAKRECADVAVAAADGPGSDGLLAWSALNHEARRRGASCVGEYEETATAKQMTSLFRAAAKAMRRG